MKVTRFLQKIFEHIKSGLNFLAIGLILYVGTIFVFGCRVFNWRIVVFRLHTSPGSLISP